MKVHTFRRPVFYRILFGLLVSAICILSGFAIGVSKPSKANKTFAWNGITATEFAGGQGTEDAPYLIATAGQLAFLAQAINENSLDSNNAVGGVAVLYNHPSKHYKLVDNIALNDVSDLSNWETAAPANEWIPIGNSSGDQFYSGDPRYNEEAGGYQYGPSTDDAFMANFDGSGYNISGIYIKDSSRSNYVGLFGAIYGGIVKNVNVDNSLIIGENHVGGIVGVAINATIMNCGNSATVKGGIGYYQYNIGGIVGGAYTSDISYCVNNGNISGGNAIGGIAGGYSVTYFENNTLESQISFSYNTGEIVGEQTLGGIAGMIEGAMELNFCYNTGRIIASGNFGMTLGGITGWSLGNILIIDCYNTGDVLGNGENDEYTGSRGVGGIVGESRYLDDSDPDYPYYQLGESGFGITIINSYNTGGVRGEESVGGIAGHASSDLYQTGFDIEAAVEIINCGNSGTIDGIISVGGILGFSNWADLVMANCVNYGTVTGDDEFGALAGLPPYTTGRFDDTDWYNHVLNSYFLKPDLGDELSFFYGEVDLDDVFGNGSWIVDQGWGNFIGYDAYGNIFTFDAGGVFNGGYDDGPDGSTTTFEFRGENTFLGALNSWVNSPTQSPTASAYEYPDVTYREWIIDDTGRPVLDLSIAKIAGEVRLVEIDNNPVVIVDNGNWQAGDISIEYREEGELTWYPVWFTPGNYEVRAVLEGSRYFSDFTTDVIILDLSDTRTVGSASVTLNSLDNEYVFGDIITPGISVVTGDWTDVSYEYSTHYEGWAANVATWTDTLISTGGRHYVRAILTGSSIYYNLKTVFVEYEVKRLELLDHYDFEIILQDTDFESGAYDNVQEFIDTLTYQFRVRPNFITAPGEFRQIDLSTENMTFYFRERTSLNYYTSAKVTDSTEFPTTPGKYGVGVIIERSENIGFILNEYPWDTVVDLASLFFSFNIIISDSDEITVTINIDDFEYSGASPEYELEINSGSIDNWSSVEIYYAVANGESLDQNNPTWTNQTPPTDVGTYWVYAKLLDTDSIFEDIITSVCEFTISKAQNTPATVVISDFMYNGVSTGVPSISSSGIWTNITYQYSTANNGPWSNTAPINAGTYYIRAQLTNGANHADTVSEVSSYTITRSSEGGGELVGVNGWKEGEVAIKPTAEPLHAEQSSYTIWYKLQSESIWISWDSVVPVAAGQYHVKAIFSQSQNYLQAESDVLVFNIVISKAENTPATVNISGFMYDGITVGEPQLVTDGDWADITYEYSTAESGPWVEIVPVNAGTYFVRAQLKNGTNHADTVSEVSSYTIARSNAGGGTLNSVSGWKEGETAIKPTAAALHAEQSSYIILYKEIKASVWTNWDDGAPVAIGQYHVKAVFAQSQNYLQADSDIKLIKIVDLSGSLVGSDANVILENFEYGTTGAPQVICNGDWDLDGVKFYYNTIAGSDTLSIAELTDEQNGWSLDAPAVAGIYYVRALLTGGVIDADYLTAATEFKILKVAGSGHIVSAAGWMYGDTPIAPTASTNTNGAPTFWYELSGMGVWTKTVPSNAGNYNVKAVFAEGINHFEFESAPFAFVIAKYDVESDLVSLVVSTNWTYLVPGTVSVISPSIMPGAVLYYKSDVQNAQWKDVKPTSPGNYYVKAVFAETANTKAFETSEVSFTIRGDIIVKTEGIDEDFFVDYVAGQELSDAENVEGYVFDGWYLNSDFSGEKVKSISDLSKNTILYAKYSEVKSGLTNVEKGLIIGFSSLGVSSLSGSGIFYFLKRRKRKEE